ncbi:CaiB/BaiF CoA transferase family protein [Rhodococcus sp. JS3073]|uniref:CaiB/BaiF CoA transferase family protein n=1 Tax=Rhodococcus sp. JS3073 TaxID=3002901 RepID=UPI002285A191|nr:CoA transferase [Rhodococcus sp. JS3073]WAM19636.1 CoA transferase [Rhodococcus sp. JS3073]
MTSALDGIRVVDLTVARAGPAAVRLLAEWGAEVVRIEIPGETGGIAADHNSSDYINLHGNKRLVTVDLKDVRGRQILDRLLESADVLVENFRPPVKNRLGIDYPTLAERFPRLVYASISGFGQDGPLGDKGAVDQIIQGMAGLMSLTGTVEAPPTRTGIAVADMAAGYLLANGTLLALLERHASGRGQWVRVSLIEALLSMLDFQAARWTVDKEVPERVGNDHPTIAPMGTFGTADGYLNVAAPNDRLWSRLCEALGHPAELSDPDFATVGSRFHNRERLKQLLEKFFSSQTRAELIARLDEFGVPCGPVNTVEEAFDDPQVRHLGVVEQIVHPVRGGIGVLRSPITMSRTSAVSKRPAPGPSADTGDVLRELGYTPEAIAELRGDGVV